jgi:hypothetical protein
MRVKAVFVERCMINSKPSGSLRDEGGECASPLARVLDGILSEQVGLARPHCHSIWGIRGGEEELSFSNRWLTVPGMGYALAREQQRYIARLVKSGRFNNQSEVVREAIRRLEREETEHLTPPPLTPAQVEEIYGPDDPQADRVGRGSFDALRKAVRKGARP